MVRLLTFKSVVKIFFYFPFNERKFFGRTFERDYLVLTREDKGDREGILHTHPIPLVIRLELFLRPQIPRGIRQQPIT